MINVNERGVDAGGVRELGYEMKQVTGIDDCVQAVVASQGITPTLLCEAMWMIEGGDLFDFAFVCSHATHRSVACCFLLAAVIYPHCQIILTTARTQREAGKQGLYD